MGMKDDISGRLKDMLAVGEYAITESDSIPGPADERLTFEKTGVLFWASTLYIDMRGSTKVLNQHKAHDVAKLHKAYLYTATTLIGAAGGQIRSYNGDSILAFFPKNANATISTAIRTAGQIKHMVADIGKAEFERYQPLNFGIGIDHGQILCVKAGRAGNDNRNDLIWLGNAVNRATVLSDKASGPNHIYISDHCCTHMDAATKAHNGAGLWTEDSIDYNGSKEKAWKTASAWAVT